MRRDSSEGDKATVHLHGNIFTGRNLLDRVVGFLLWEGEEGSKIWELSGT